jgi:hypothetical protein
MVVYRLLVLVLFIYTRAASSSNNIIWRQDSIISTTTNPTISTTQSINTNYVNIINKYESEPNISDGNPLQSIRHTLTLFDSLVINQSINISISMVDYLLITVNVFVLMVIADGPIYQSNLTIRSIHDGELVG